MKTSRPRSFLSHMLLLSIIALPACNPLDWMRGKGSGCGCPHTGAHETHDAAKTSSGEDVALAGFEPAVLKETVVSLDGKPVVTGADFEKNMQLILEVQPTIKDWLNFMTQEQQDQMIGQLIDTMATEKLIRHEVQALGLDKDPEYIQNAQRMHEMLDRDIMNRAFESALLKEIVITDDAARKYYNDNKATEPIFQRLPFSSQQAGVKAESFEVATEKEAEDLANKARANTDFAQVAQEAKATVNDLGLVNANSFVDPEVKEVLLSATTFPSVFVVKGADGKFTVVKAISKQDAQYADYETVADAVKQVMTGKEFNDLYTKRMADLKEKYKLEVNKDYINKRKRPEDKAATAGAMPAFDLDFDESELGDLAAQLQDTPAQAA